MKQKLPFSSDYMQLAHPLILERMAQSAAEPFVGYGKDEVCEAAVSKIRRACAAPDAEIHFLVGGTQTNQITIDALLQPYQGVLAAETAHIAQHEAGAIESSGHKVLVLPQHDGKLLAEDVEAYMQSFYADESWDHMVIPGMVYVTHPTEYGTLYTQQELQSLHDVCVRRHLPLYLDGARLGYGLMASQTDVTLPDIARLCDAFYIGGTKVGAMLGEAIVFPRPHIVNHFFTQVKRHNSLLAKGWIVGMQFDVLFTDDLYFKISRHAVLMAERLREGLRRKGYQFFIDSPTNQQFIVLTSQQVEQLGRSVAYGFSQNLPDGRKVIRLATSWYTTEAQVDQLLQLL